MSSILYSLPVEWFEIRQRFHYVAEGLAETHDVTVLAPRSHQRLLRARRWAEMCRTWSEAPLGDTGRILSVATLPFYRRHPSLVSLQWRTQPRRLLKAALSRRQAYDVLWLADPLQGGLAQALPHETLVYECVDDHAGFWQDARLKAQIVAAETELVKRADVVIVTSRALQERLSAHHPRVVLVGNGTDVAYFAAVCEDPAAFPRPADLPDAEGPLIGFYGALGDWLDYDLVRETALRKPEWQFVFIGPIFTDVSPLKDLPNVHLLGARPFEQLRDYLAHIQVWTLPFKVNAMTAAVDPLKAYEYLAAGRQVVSTFLPELAPFDDVLALTRSQVEWIEALECALGRPARSGAEFASLRGRLSSRDWRHQVEQIEAHLGIRRVSTTP